MGVLRRLQPFGLILTTLLALVMLVHLALYGVDFPIYDEWDIYVNDFLAKPLNWHWLLGQHNEHRILFTRLVGWLFYRISHLEFVSHQIFTFLLFVCMVGWTFWFARKYFSNKAALTVAWFLPFFFSPAFTNIYQFTCHTAFHASFLFFFFAVVLLWNEKPTSLRILLGITSLFVSIFSNSHGVVMALIALPLLFAFYFLRVQKRSHGFFIVVAAATLLMLLGWFSNYHHPASIPPLTSPFRKEFWAVFFNLQSLAFGFETISVPLGLICFLFLALPVFLLTTQERYRKNVSCWQLAVILLALFATLGSISMGRGAYGGSQSKNDRYLEFTVLLIPFVVLAWQTILKDRPKILGRVLVTLWFLSFLGFSDDWDFRRFGFYRDMRIKGMECVYKKYNEHPNREMNCDMVYFGDFRPKIQKAMDLKLSLLKTLREHRPCGSSQISQDF